MRKLVAMIALVAVLFLTSSAFANGNGPPGEIPPKPGTGSNPGLWNAMLTVPTWAWGQYIVSVMLFTGHFPWQDK